MTPTKQTILGSKGNCFAACIATILDCDIGAIPDLNAYEESNEWMGVLNKWLEDKRLSYFEARVARSDMKDFFGTGDYYHTILGPTKQSATIHHCVVGRKGEIVFDPHPTPLDLISGKSMRIGVFIHSGI